MLFPLIFLVVWLGSFMGLDRTAYEDKWVFLSAEHSPHGQMVYGTACAPTIRATQCEELPWYVPDGTVVLYPSAWQSDIIVQRHVVRHEVEHLLRVEGESPGDTQDEASVSEIACRDVYSVVFCR